MAYFRAPALDALMAEVNTLWPHRDKTSDGWIGDTSHQARPSDHNPAPPTGIVRAQDIDEDLVAGLTAVGEAMPLVYALLADPRTRYVIYEGEIWTRTATGWKRAPYTGPNAHRHHIHVSVRSVNGHDLDRSPWHLAARMSNTSGETPTITIPTIPGAPAPIEEDDMNKDQDAALARVLQINEALVKYILDPKGRGYQADSRVLGVLPDKRNADKTVATVLTTAEGQVLRDDIAASTARAVAETSAAYHQLVGLISGQAGTDLDPDAFADAVVAAVGTDLAAAFVDALADRLTKED